MLRASQLENLRHNLGGIKDMVPPVLYRFVLTYVYGLDLPYGLSRRIPTRDLKRFILMRIIDEIL